MSVTRVLVTGCNGFVGDRLVSSLINRSDIKIIGSCRQSHAPLCKYNIELRSFNLEDRSNLDELLNGIDVVIHTAGIAHDLKGANDRDLEAYFDINANATLDLARSAAHNGVNKFIFISSVKVNGENTAPDQPFDHNSIAHPSGIYAESKYQAEKGLREIAKNTGLKFTIIRPSLIYGSSPKGNLATLSSMIKRGIPIPVGFLTDNRRSLINIDNLIDLIIECVFNPFASNQLFLASDDIQRSTKDIVDLLGELNGLQPKIVDVPIFMLKIFGLVFGKSEMINKLLTSLEVDISHTKTTLS